MRSPSCAPAGATGRSSTRRRACGRFSRSRAGGRPSSTTGYCFERGIRVLSAAPAFAGAVAEMALGLALSSSRDIVVGDRAMRSRDERWLSAAGDLDTFLLSGKRVGIRRLRQHRQAPESAPRAVRLSDVRLRPLAHRRLPPGRAGRAGRARAAPRDVAGDLRARDTHHGEPGDALARPARADPSRVAARAGEPGARRRLRGSDRARACRSVPRSDRRLPARAVGAGSPDPGRTWRGALAAPGRARRGSAPRDRPARRRRSRGARPWCCRRGASRRRSRSSRSVTFGRRRSSRGRP